MIPRLSPFMGRHTRSARCTRKKGISRSYQQGNNNPINAKEQHVDQVFAGTDRSDSSPRDVGAPG
ncbi:MAG: hypothetical protein R6V72_00950 [Cyclobacterium sp.]|uniref:hypothetical protein n=1 Tax=Cyclobacterium sp. TaxID=1966343 RepID=UPI003970CF69